VNLTAGGRSLIIKQTVFTKRDTGGEVQNDAPPELEFVELQT
jgi:hypothetical protein